MHPVFDARGRLVLYLATWLPIAGLLAALLAQDGIAWLEAVLLAGPLALIYAFICLAAWYPSRALPLRHALLWRVISTHALAAVLSSSIWQLAGAGWSLVLDRSGLFAGAYSRYGERLTLFFIFGLLLYLLAAAASYLGIAFESSRAAEKLALDAQQREAMAARELELGRSFQRRLLPPQSQQREGYRLATRNLPAQGVAGDFYDYFELPDGRLALAVADVSGKGIAASLVMATVKAVLPLLAAERSVVETLAELNRRLASELSAREFVALTLAFLDPRSGVLELANAGLPDPYVVTGGQAPRMLEVPQPRLPLGLRKEITYGSIEARLAPGEALLMLTDGLPEAPITEGEPLGYEALGELIGGCAGEPDTWLDDLFQRVEAATLDRRDDDWTALLVRPTLGSTSDS